MELVGHGNSRLSNTGLEGISTYPGLGDALALGDRDRLGLILNDADFDGERLADGLMDSLADREGLMLADGDIDADGEIL